MDPADLTSRATPRANADEADEMRMSPLCDVRVLDLTQVVSGPAATMLLADLGAEVIKIEQPGSGEPYRREGRIVANERGAVSVNFLRLNRNKKSLTLDLKQQQGREVLLRLAAISDVLVENFRPGVMDRLGLGYETVRRANPRLIYASISGFGSEDLLPSPQSDTPAYAIISEAYAGLLHLNGEAPTSPPHWMGFALGDTTAGHNAVIGILTALYDRHRSGRGRRVDVAMYDAAMFMNDQAITLYSATGEVMRRGPYSLQAPWGIFPGRDGYVVIAVMGERQWANLCNAIGRPDLAEHPGCRTGELRARHLDDVIRPALEPWLIARDRQEISRVMEEHGVPAAPVNTAADLFDSPHVAAREMLVPFTHPVVGEVKTVGNPVKLSDAPQVPTTCPPELGEHTDEILRDILHLSVNEIEQLRARAVV